MRHFLIGVTLAVTAATAIGPVRAQVPFPSPAAAPAQWQAAYVGGTYRDWPYPFPSLTPWDAYRQGLINRWELEQWVGPIPQALQGPSPDGGNQDGGNSKR